MALNWDFQSWPHELVDAAKDVPWYLWLIVATVLVIVLGLMIVYRYRRWCRNVAGGAQSWYVLSCYYICLGYFKYIINTVIPRYSGGGGGIFLSN